MLLFICLLFCSNVSHAQTAPPAPAAPAVVAPAVTVAGLMKFNEALYGEKNNAGKVVLLVFSRANDAITLQQKQMLLTILASAEFTGLDVFEVDIDLQKDIAAKFKVSQPATMIFTKKSAERIRSTGMVKQEAITKMLRLQNVL